MSQKSNDPTVIGMSSSQPITAIWIDQKSPFINVSGGAVALQQDPLSILQRC